MKIREQVTEFWHRLIRVYSLVATAFSMLAYNVYMVCCCCCWLFVYFFHVYISFPLIQYYSCYFCCCCCCSPFIWHCCLLVRRNVNNSKCHFQSPAWAYTLGCCCCCFIVLFVCPYHAYYFFYSLVTDVFVIR